MTSGRGPRRILGVVALLGLLTFGTPRPAAADDVDDWTTLWPFPFGQQNEVYPHLAVGSLDVFFPDEEDPFRCTAVSVSSQNLRVGMTSAHCLYQDGQFANQALFLPGSHNRQETSGGRFFLDLDFPRIYIPPGFVNGDQGNDVAFFRTWDWNANVNLNQFVGAFGVQFQADRDHLITTLGYPYVAPFTGDYQMMTHADYAGTIPVAGPDVTRFGGNACVIGHSGGPVIDKFTSVAGVAGLNYVTHAMSFMPLPDQCGGAYLDADAQAAFVAAESS